MKKKVWVLLGAAGGLLSIIGYGWKNRNAASIGIIGGADGPTAIYVAGKTGLMFYAGVALLMAAIIGLSIAFIFRRK